MAKAARGRIKRRKKRVVRLAALNVKVDPHPTGIYLRLFERAAKDGKAVQISGDRAAQVATCMNFDDRTFVGNFWTYTRIDRKKAAFDLKNRKVMSKAEVAQLLSATLDTAGVNGKPFGFGFDVDSHTLVYEHGKMSPRVLATVLEKILHSVKAGLGINNISVDVVQDEAVLERIFALRLRWLEIKITRPNPDDLADLAEEIRDELAKQKAKAITRKLEAEEDQALVPDERTIQLSAVGVANGHVTGHGYDPTSKRVVSETTASAPLIHAEVYDPKDDNPDNFLSRAASRFVEVAKERLKAFKERMKETARKPKRP